MVAINKRRCLADGLPVFVSDTHFRAIADIAIFLYVGVDQSVAKL